VVEIASVDCKIRFQNNVEYVKNQPANGRADAVDVVSSADMGLTQFLTL